MIKIDHLLAKTRPGRKNRPYDVGARSVEKSPECGAYLSICLPAQACHITPLFSAESKR